MMNEADNYLCDTRQDLNAMQINKYTDFQPEERIS